MLSEIMTRSRVAGQRFSFSPKAKGSQDDRQGTDDRDQPQTTAPGVTAKVAARSAPPLVDGLVYLSLSKIDAGYSSNWRRVGASFVVRVQ